MSKVEQQVLTLLQSNPAGLRRAEIVDVLDVTSSTTEISRALGALIGYGKINKFGDIYKAAKSAATPKPAPETEEEEELDEEETPVPTLKEVVRKHVPDREAPKARPVIQSETVQGTRIIIAGRDFGLFEPRDSWGSFTRLVGPGDSQILLCLAPYATLNDAPAIEGVYSGRLVHASDEILEALQ